MIADALLQLASAQAFTSSDEVTTNTVSIEDARQLGDGEPLCLVFNITTAATGDGGSQTDATSFRVVTDTVAALSSPTNVAEVTRLNATLTAGAQVVVLIPPGPLTELFLGGQVVLGTGDTVSADCFVAPLSFVPKRFAGGYPAGVTVL